MPDDTELLRAIRELYIASIKTAKVLNSMVHEVDGANVSAANDVDRANRKARQLLGPLMERFGDGGRLHRD